MACETVVHLVRHGEVHNPDGLFYGRLPGFGLSCLGEAQAQAAARSLAGVPCAALYCSPMQRAQETARIIQAAHRGLRVRISSRLNEVCTPYDGLRKADGLPELRIRRWVFEPPYERSSVVLQRLQLFLRHVRRHHRGRCVIAVTHGDPLMLVALWALRLPLDPASPPALVQAGMPNSYPAYASIVTLTYHTDEPDELPALAYDESASAAVGRPSFL